MYCEVIKIQGLNNLILFDIASDAKSSKITEKKIPSFEKHNIDTAELIDDDEWIIALQEVILLLLSFSNIILER